MNDEPVRETVKPKLPVPEKITMDMINNRYDTDFVRGLCLSAW